MVLATDAFFIMLSTQNGYSAPSVDTTKRRFEALSTSGAMSYHLLGTSVSALKDLGAQMGRLKSLHMPQKGIVNLKKSLQTAFWSPMASKGAFQGTH